MKKLLKSFTPYQIIFLSVVFLLTAAFVIFLPGEMLDETSDAILEVVPVLGNDQNVYNVLKSLVMVAAVIAALANPLCEMLISKQSRVNFVVDILFIEIPEALICLWNGWYAILGATLIFWIPIDVLSILRWSRKIDEEDQEKTIVRRLPWQWDAAIILAILAFGFGIGTALKQLPGAADSYLDAFATAFGMANGILLMLRLSEQWYAWFITLIFYVILYVRAESFIMLIPVTAMFVNTCYGFVKWLIYTKKHGQVIVVGRRNR